MHLCVQKAVKTEIVEHESDPAVHFEIVLNFVAALEDEKELLRKEQKVRLVLRIL